MKYSDFIGRFGTIAQIRMSSSLIPCALLVGLLGLLTFLPSSLSTTTPTNRKQEQETAPYTCNMCCHGPPGQPGIPGVPGTPGGFGPAGAPGSKGDRGEFISETGARGQKGEAGNVGVKGNKGSEGTPGKQGPLGRIGPQGDKGNNGSKGDMGEPGLALQVHKSAFTAVRTTNVEPSESVISFTSLEINVGEDFDTNTGKFTCRVSGVYYFMFSFLTYIQSSTYVKMWLNGRAITTVHRSEVSGHDQLSSGATVRLNVGDQVWLTNEGGRRVYGGLGNPLTFTGFMIYDMN